MIYAEVIGDPIVQSKSPVIHKYWLDRMGIEGDYIRTRVAPDELPGFLVRRRADSDWRGCNVTIPHKQAIIPMLDRLEAGVQAIGAVNCVVPDGAALVGYNTDIDGVGAALDTTELGGHNVAVIGAGGAARAVVGYLAQRGVDRIAIIARSSERAAALRPLSPNIDILPFAEAHLGFCGAVAIVNASSLGMAGADPMPQPLLDAVCNHARDATIFDMVTTPAETGFLSAGRQGDGHTVDGLTMLVGQAARAFTLFFGVPAPPPDDYLRGLLATDSRDSG